ncbi:MAG: hypothetical protein AAF690_02955 [Acidobacteriota bacterium]
MTGLLSAAFALLLVLSLAGLVVEVTILLFGLRRWLRVLRVPRRSAVFAGGESVPVCFVFVGVEPTSVGVLEVADRLTAEFGHGARPYELRVLLPGESGHSLDLVEELGAVRLPRGPFGLSEVGEAFALSSGRGGQVLFQRQAGFGELLRSVAQSARSPYFAVLPVDALPRRRELEAMMRILAERSDDPVVLGSPAALAFRGETAGASWKELRRSTSYRSALLAWGGPGTRGMSAFWAAPLLLSRERLLETTRQPTFDRSDWLERLGARDVAVAVTTVPSTERAALAPFWVSSSGMGMGRATWRLLSVLVAVRSLLLGVAIVLLFLGEVHPVWGLSAFAAALVMPSCLRLLGHLGLELAFGLSNPSRLLRLVIGSACLAPFASGFARRGWI